MLFLFAILFPFFAIFGTPYLKPMAPAYEVVKPVVSYPDSEVSFHSESAYPPPEFGQMFTNVQLVDINQDNKLDVVACDARRGIVVNLIRQADGTWVESVLNSDYLISAPSHATPIDLDQDGDLDFVVAALGGIMPTNGFVGRVFWLNNTGDGYETVELLRDVRRVTDVQPGDFDGDGDTDLVVAVFGGLLQGQILWLENNGNQEFTDYELMTVSGTIHVPVEDFDGDGDLDVAAIVTQEEEEVWIFENDGTGLNDAVIHRVYTSWNFDLGGAGMTSCDLDQDGDKDLLVSLGDNLELINNFPQPWHGCLWLENKGDLKFESKHIGSVPGVYGCAPGDFDGDGDTDVAVVTMFNDWNQENSASVVWLENDGQQNFKTWQVSDRPIQLASVACGDIDQDGRDDIVTTCFQFRSPADRFGSVDIFLNEGKK